MTESLVGKNIYESLPQPVTSPPLLVKAALFLVPVAILGVTPRLWITSIIATSGYLVLMVSFLTVQERPGVIGKRVWFYCLSITSCLIWGMLRSSVYSSGISYGVQEGLYFILIIIPFSIAVSSLCQRTEDITYILWGYVALGSAIAILTVAFSTRYILGADRYRWSGNLCAINALILLQFWIVRNKAVAIILALISTMAVLITGCRQSLAILGIGVLTMLLIYLLHWRNNIKRILIVALILIFAVFFWNTIINLKVSSLMLIRYHALRTSSYGDRSWLFRLAWRAFLEYPFFGTGIGEFTNRYTGSTGLYPHNVFLEILCELGIFGVLVFFVPIFISEYQILRQWIMFGKPSLSHLLILCVCFMVAASISGNFASNRSMWLFAILTLHFTSRRMTAGKALAATV